MKKGILYALITAVLFVTLEPVSKLIAEEVTPYAITFWRFLIGSFILIPPAIIKIRKEKIKITAKDLGITTLLGILFICVSMVSLQLAVKQSEAPSLIAIIFSANSVFTIIFALFIIKEKMNRYKLTALLFGIIGVVACIDFSSGTNLTSVALAVFAALTFSLYTALSQKYMKKLGGVIQTCLVFLTGSLVLLVVLLIGGIDVSPSFRPQSFAILLYLGFLVTGVGYASYFKGIETGGAIMASLAFFIKPILTPFVTWIINGIVPDIKVFLAVLCIVVASYFAVYKKQAPKLQNTVEN